MYRLIQYIFVVLAYCLIQTHTWAQKPYNELQVSQVNLKQYPKDISIQPPGVEVTIGDLHGNSLKLLNFLIRNDVVKIPEDDYELFVKIYYKNPDELTSKDLAFFQVILDAAQINNQHKIRFLGDDLCDRGMNDFYSLAIYKRLDSEHVPFDIVLSNHGNFFLTAYERPEQSFDYNPYGEGENEPTVQSMLNMGKLIDRGLLNKQDILATVQNHYLKHLKFPGYTVNKEKNEITIYSHAPIDLTIISALATDLKITFNDSNLNELTKSMNLINQQINQWIMSNTFTLHYHELNQEHTKTGTLSPMKQILWNRDYAILKRENIPENKFYSVNYVHGHDSMPHVVDLDNLFGKSNDLYQGPYAIYLTHP